MKRLKQVLWLGASGGTFPWKWNEKSFQIDKWSPGAEKVWQVVWYIFFIQNFLIGGYQIYVFWDIVSTGEKSNRENFMTFDNVLLAFLAIDFSLIMLLYREEVKKQFNHISNELVYVSF